MQLLSAGGRWRDGAMIGAEFASPMHVAVFEHLMAKARAPAQ